MAAVVHPDEVHGRVEGGIDERTTFDRTNGCEHLTQQVIRVQPGHELERSVGDAEQEILFVVEGAGELRLNGQVHHLEPDTGAYVLAGERYTVSADERLLLTSVTAPLQDQASPVRKVTVRFADQPELEASPERSFRYLVNESAGCLDMTQFIGIVQPSKAPFHSHPYDEVGYVIEGLGIAHVDGEQVPLRAGSCFHLAPEEVHCIENSGAGPMRILGVFHPSGSPADRTYQRNN
jgi:mannose-6-phosphate isomerase-like protein (cupin superfamily)